MQIRQRSFESSKRLTYTCFLIPALLLYLIVVIIPFFQGIPYSFTNWNLISNASNFIGVKNYQTLFKSKEFWTIVKNTFQFTLYYVVLSNALGLAVALMLHRSNKLNNLCRTIIFMPYVISLVTAAFVWRYIYSAIYSPLFNVVSPLGSKNTAMFAIAIISVWRTSGYCMLIYIAGLQGVADEYYEAASVEGANGIQKFFKITVPMLIPAFSANVWKFSSVGFLLKASRLAVISVAGLKA